MATKDNGSLIDAMLATRKGYDQERTWHKFMMDAYLGTGGFQGRVRQEAAGYWGAGAEMYAVGAATSLLNDDREEQGIDTYLDRYPREDIAKFRRRVSLSYYENYVEPVVDIRLSYMSRKPFAYEGAELLQSAAEGQRSFWDDADGKGTSWLDLVTKVLRTRASVLGWTPVLFDSPPVELPPGQQLSVSQARAMGVRPRAIPLFPANLLDFSLDREGAFVWAKVLTTHCERPDPFGAETVVKTVRTWFRDRVRTTEIVETKDAESGDTKPQLRSDRITKHNFGRVPLLVIRAKPAPEDPVRGVSTVGALAQAARRLFNYQSELDEHLRACVFAMLQVPTKDPKGIRGLVGGNANTLPVPPDATQGYAWLAPPPEVAETYEKRLAEVRSAIYRMGRVEFAKTGTDGGTAQQSGVSRAYEFESTNRAIADMAAQFARFEQEALQLVAAMTGAQSSALSDLRVVPPAKFDVEEMAKEITEAMDAVGLDLGPTANGEIKLRLALKLLPNLSPDKEAQIRSEIEQLAQEQAQANAAAREMAMNPGEQETDEDGNPVDDEPLPDDLPPERKLTTKPLPGAQARPKRRAARPTKE